MSVLLDILKKKGHFQNLGVDGVILKSILNKSVRRAWNSLIRRRMGKKRRALLNMVTNLQSA
jgi:hypothetical protein